MLKLNTSGQVVSVDSAVVATGYQVVKADGTVATGGGATSNQTLFGQNVNLHSLVAADVDSLGPIIIIGNTGLATAGAVNDTVENTPSIPGDAMTLTAAYDLAKTAAQAGAAMTLTAGERNDIAAALLDLADAVEMGITVRKTLRAIAAAICGVGGPGGGHTLYGAIGNAATPRVDATTPGGGTRSAVSLTL